MTTKRVPEPQVHQAPRPVMHEGRPFCPRCDGRLLFDWEAFKCVACGYEYVLEPAELSRYLSGRRPERRVAGIATAAGLVAGLGAVPVLGKLGVFIGLAFAGAVLASELLRAVRRRGSERP